MQDKLVHPPMLELIWSLLDRGGDAGAGVQRHPRAGSRTCARPASAIRWRSWRSIRCVRSNNLLWGYMQDEQAG